MFSRMHTLQASIPKPTIPLFYFLLRTMGEQCPDLRDSTIPVGVGPKDLRFACGFKKQRRKKQFASGFEKTSAKCHIQQEIMFIGVFSQVIHSLTTLSSTLSATEPTPFTTSLTRNAPGLAQHQTFPVRCWPAQHQASEPNTGPQTDFHTIQPSNHIGTDSGRI